MNVEERLRAAMHAVSDDVQPDEVGGLTAVRARGRAARRRRALLGGATATLALVAGSVAVARLGGDTESMTLSGEPSVPATASSGSTAPPTASPQPTTPTSPTTAPTTVPTTVPTTTPGASGSVFDQVIWPGPGHVLFDDPVAAARSFVEEFIGFDEAPLGEFHADGPDIGTVDVHNLTELGAASEQVMSTITVQRFGGHWYVTAAVSVNVQIDSPAAHAEVTSPVRVEGRSQGFESTIVVVVRDAFSDPGENLGEKVTMGGSYEGPLPYSALVPLSAPSGPTGVIIASTDSGGPGGNNFAAIPVSFVPAVSGPGEPGEVTTLRVFFPRSADGELVEVERTVPQTTGVLRASLVAMLDGPTDDERTAGLTTRFPLDSGGVLEDVALSDGLATVRLSSRLAEWPLAAVDEVIAQLNATVFQFDNVAVVRYQLGGSCDAFDAWLNQGCEFTRERDAVLPPLSSQCPDEGLGVEELQAAVDAGHQPWRLSARDVAAACTFGLLPSTAVEPAGEDTFKVTELSTGSTVLITVAQPLRSGPGGIWVVTSLVVPAATPARPPGDAPCRTEAILPVVRQQLSQIEITSVDIAECQNGYARVIVRFDTSRCGNDGTCGEEADQVFLVADGDAWTYLTSGTGIECEDGAVFPPPLPDVLAACQALGLR